MRAASSESRRSSIAVDAMSAAEQLIRATGARVTQGRILVLEVLQAAGRALTHHEIEAAVAGPLDRVTVYRVLDWLTREQIAHKIPGDDRVWRFTIAGQKQAHHHAHFQCTDCSQVICLDDVPSTLRPRLPAGYRSVGVEVTVKGQCKACVRPAPRRGRR
ncbi:MAG: Fur family transcriptional regulator [bacterium]|jgi:Fur family ferric uptake transcriptional regulator|nr:transcriptional repressor [Betaproteobacteria bacterium]